MHKYDISFGVWIKCILLLVCKTCTCCTFTNVEGFFCVCGMCGLFQFSEKLFERAISSCLSVQACQIRRSGQAAKRLDSGEPTARDRFVPQAHFDAGMRLDPHKETRASSAVKPLDQPPSEQKF